MYSEKLEEVIAAAIADGNLTDQKRNIIKRRAEKEGEDVEEVMMVVESRLQNISNASVKKVKAAKISKSKTEKEDYVSSSFVEIVNGVSFKMIKVEGGTFTMFNRDDMFELNPNSVAASTPELAQMFMEMRRQKREKLKRQNVTLDDFYIGEYLVTQGLWKAVMGKDNNPSHQKGDNLPVHNISWEESKAFLKKLNVITKKNYRLPSEAQWEYAAIGGKQGLGYKFAGSDDPYKVAWGAYNTITYTQHDMINMYNANHLFKKNKVSDSVRDYFFKNYKRDFYEVQPVGKLRPNELGLYDISGNVSEFCEDDYDEEPMLTKGKNPIFHVANSLSKVKRSFSCNENEIGVGGRSFVEKDIQEIYTGFRIVL